MYHIDETKMLRDARLSLSPGARVPNIFFEGMIFVLVTYISSLPQSFVLSIYATVQMLLDPKYYEMLLSDTIDTNAILEYAVGLTENIPTYVYALTIAASGFMILGAIIYCKAFQKRSPHTLGFVRRGVIPEYLTGALIGALMIGLLALACHVTGCVTFTINGNADPLMILLFLGAFLLQGMGEEALFRGYLVTGLSRSGGVWPAIITSSLVFAAFHAGNPNFTLLAFVNIALFGLFAGIYMLKRGSIWGIGAIHALWNFTQSNVFGFNVSGNPYFESLITAEARNVGTILSGGEFGLEGGLGMTVIMLIAILLALLMPTKKSELCAPIPKSEQAQ